MSTNAVRFWTPRRRVAVLVAAALTFATLPLLPPVLTADAGHFSNTEELSAESNVGAAIAYSVSTFTEAAEVVLGRDDTFPDSLASGMLQATRPLLLTKTDALTAETKAEIQRLKATTVHILGGTSAVSQAVEDELKGLGLTVNRYSGTNRIETAVDVASKLGAAATKAIVARAFGSAEDESRGFADSLAAGGWAASAELPVLLTETEKLSDATAAYLRASAIKEVFVVGGNAAVSEAAFAQLTALGMTVKRVSGPTRFHTALAIAGERGFASAADATKVILTEGQAPDAWAAGFAAAARAKKDNAPIVLSVGETLPEPTQTFLGTGGGEPTPEPTEEPTGEPSPSPSPTGSPSPEPTGSPSPEPTGSPSPEPTGSPSPEPTGSPSPEEPPAEGGATGLLCAPRVPTAACDAAATALGQIAGAGPQLITFEVPAVGRYDHVVGQIAAPETVNGVTVTGCGYTSQPIYVDEQGTLYLMLAEPQGTCSAEFTLDTTTGVKKQTVEFTIGEDFTPASALPIPELVNVRPVMQDDEGVHLRFSFDEPIAPAPAIDASKFRLRRFDATENANPSAHRPVSIKQDPRNPRAVLAAFQSVEYAKSTAVYVLGGELCTNTTSPCSTTWAPHPTLTGAVRDIDGFPNPHGHFGLNQVDFTAASTDDPDLVSVSGYDSATQSLLLTFSEPVKVPEIAKQAAGAATLVLQDGTVKKSDVDGWSSGPDETSLRVSFADDVLAAADMEQVRRAFVTAGTVPSVDTNGQTDHNTPLAIVVAAGGITVRPDFVGVEDENFPTTGSHFATFVFEEDIEDFVDPVGPTRNAKFVAVKRTGQVVVASNVTFADNTRANRRKFKAEFAAGSLGNDVLYYSVLTDAVKAFASQKTNFADTIRRASPEVFEPGITKAPDLTAVKARLKDNPGCSVGTGGTKDEFELSYTFDQTIDNVSSNTASPHFANFVIWAVEANVLKMTKAWITGTKSTNSVGEKWPTNSTCTGTDQGDTAVTTNPAEVKFAKYLTVDFGKVDGSGLVNYAAGMPVPN